MISGGWLLPWSSRCEGVPGLHLRNEQALIFTLDRSLSKTSAPFFFITKKKSRDNKGKVYYKKLQKKINDERKRTKVIGFPLMRIQAHIFDINGEDPSKSNINNVFSSRRTRFYQPGFPVEFVPQQQQLLSSYGNGHRRLSRKIL